MSCLIINLWLVKLLDFLINKIEYLIFIPENGVDTGNELPQNCYSVYRRIKSLKKGGEFIG